MSLIGPGAPSRPERWKRTAVDLLASWSLWIQETKRRSFGVCVYQPSCLGLPGYAQEPLIILIKKMTSHRDNGKMIIWSLSVRWKTIFFMWFCISCIWYGVQLTKIGLIHLQWGFLQEKSCPKFSSERNCISVLGYCSWFHMEYYGVAGGSTFQPFDPHVTFTVSRSVNELSFPNYLFLISQLLTIVLVPTL